MKIAIGNKKLQYQKPHPAFLLKKVTSHKIIFNVVGAFKGITCRVWCANNLMWHKQYLLFLHYRQTKYHTDWKGIGALKEGIIIVLLKSRQVEWNKHYFLAIVFLYATPFRCYSFTRNLKVLRTTYNYLSNRPQFLWVNRRDNTLGMSGEHSPSVPDLPAFLVFSQHPEWVITPVNP